MRELNKIIVHCSASPFGSAEIIDQWHRAKGWDGIGYHFVILNGITKSGNKFDKKLDSFIEEGRPLEKIGAHCKGYNTGSIGVCLIGDEFFTGRQLYQALPELLIDLCKNHKIEPKEIYGHYELDSHKSCPNIKAEQIKMVVSGVF